MEFVVPTGCLHGMSCCSEFAVDRSLTNFLIVNVCFNSWLIFNIQACWVFDFFDEGCFPTFVNSHERVTHNLPSNRNDLVGNSFLVAILLIKFFCRDIRKNTENSLRRGVPAPPGLLTGLGSLQIYRIRKLFSF